MGFILIAFWFLRKHFHSKANSFLALFPVCTLRKCCFKRFVEFMASFMGCAPEDSKLVSVEAKTHKVVLLSMLQLSFYCVVIALSHSYQLSNIIVAITKGSNIDFVTSIGRY